MITGRDLTAQTGRKSYRRVTWRRGSKGAMRSRFRVQAVRPAGVAARTHAMARAAGAAGWDGVPPALTLLSCDIPGPTRPENHPPEQT
ncbi:hypothetical protein ACQPYK_26160 [Streptosporangium sp. CA-135522]|uniref:hypothetical protein n=1 Tax=Streptosporangium sp. CA-135522 TaxID=3240072 RepID=UPI003D8CC437